MLPAQTFTPPDETAAPPANGELSTWVTAGGALEWRSSVCPLPIVGEHSAEVLRLLEWWREHILPMAGGLYDQPNLYLQSMELLEARFAAARREAK